MHNLVWYVLNWLQLLRTDLDTLGRTQEPEESMVCVAQISSTFPKLFHVSQSPERTSGPPKPASLQYRSKFSTIKSLITPQFFASLFYLFGLAQSSVRAYIQTLQPFAVNKLINMLQQYTLVFHKKMPYLIKNSFVPLMFKDFSLHSILAIITSSWMQS